MLWILAACTGDKDGPADQPHHTDTHTGTPPAASPFVFADGAPPSNILMISIDTLRSDALGRYGGPATPFLDRILSEGVALDRHYSCSNWTFNATTCALGGSDPIDWGFVPAIEGPKIVEDVPPDREFLAHWLGAAGFTTFLLTSNTFMSSVHGNGTGYDYETRMTNETAAEDVIADALGLLGQVPATPWFFHFHLMDPHQPYNPPAEYLTAVDGLPSIPYDLSGTAGYREFTADLYEQTVTPEVLADVTAHMEARYAADVRYLDDQLALAWDELEAMGLLDDTLVVLWTDHGEQIFEHGYHAHANLLNQEENSAILGFWAKDLQPASWDGLTWAGDMAPTLLDLYDIPIPPAVTGLPVGQASAARPLFAFTRAKNGTFQSVRVANDHLVFGWSDPATVLPAQLPGQGIHYFDTAVDPGEANDLYDPTHPAVLALWDELLPYVNAASDLLPGDTIAWPEGLPR